tara:strand:+ start:142 stop:348 length:207 start_codon:yes stop_codon:yes gene_type:complete
VADVFKIPVIPSAVTVKTIFRGHKCEAAIDRVLLIIDGDVIPCEDGRVFCDIHEEIRALIIGFKNVVI